MDCVFETISNKMKNYTVSNLILMNGIKNDFFRFPYANTSIELVDGRGNPDPVKLLHDLGVDFISLDSTDLINLEDYSNIIIFMSKDMILNIEILNDKIIQPLFYYSAFIPVESKKDKIQIKLLYDKEYEIHFDDLKKLSLVHTFPMKIPVKIVKLKNTNQKMNINKRKIYLDMLLFCKSLCGKKDNADFFSGLYMYDELINSLSNIANISDSKTKQLKLNFLTASINSGNVGLYRREYIDALSNYLCIPKEIMKTFNMLSNAWREIGRILINIRTNKLEYTMHIAGDVKEILLYLKTNEIVVMEKLYKIIECENWNDIQNK